MFIYPATPAIWLCKMAIRQQTHYEVGQKVRQTIKDLGGTMPEALPSPDKSIQQLKIAVKSKDAPE